MLPPLVRRRPRSAGNQVLPPPLLLQAVLLPLLLLPLLLLLLAPQRAAQAQCFDPIVLNSATAVATWAAPGGAGVAPAAGDTPVAPPAPANEGAPQLFDGDFNTKFLSFRRVNTGAVVALNGGGSVSDVGAVQLVTANDYPVRTPARITVEGSSEADPAVAAFQSGSAWTLLYEGDSGLLSTTPFNTRGALLYTSASSAGAPPSGTYRTFRILVTATRDFGVNGSFCGSAQFSELELYGPCPSTTGTGGIAPGSAEGVAPAAGALTGCAYAPGSPCGTAAATSGTYGCCDTLGGVPWRWASSGITNTITGLGSNDEDVSDAIALPAAFSWYGMSYSSIVMSTNGWFAFGDSTTAPTLNHIIEIPSTDLPADGVEPVVATCWDDMRVTAATYGTAMNGVNPALVVQYTAEYWERSSDVVTMQAWFTPATGQVELHYQSTTPSGSLDCIVGWQNADASQGFMVRHGHAAWHDFSVLIAPVNAPIPTTGVATTGVPTTGVPTTGVPTTGVPTTGVATTGAQGTTASTGTTDTTTAIPGSTGTTGVSTGAPSTTAAAASTTAPSSGTPSTPPPPSTPAPAPTPAPSPSPPTAPTVSQDGDEAGESEAPFPWPLVAGVAGGVCCCVIIVVAGVLLLRRRSRQGSDSQGSSSLEMAVQAAVGSQRMTLGGDDFEDDEDDEALVYDRIVLGAGGMLQSPDQLVAVDVVAEESHYARLDEGQGEALTSPTYARIPKVSEMMAGTASEPPALSANDLMVDPNTKLGEGEFGVVLRGQLHGVLVAVKAVKDNASQDAILEAYAEAKLLAAIPPHPNVMGLVGVTTNPFLIVTEFCPGGSLYRFLRKTPDVTRARQLQLTRDIAAGMAHLAENKFVHRDLAARNVLLDKDGVGQIADFGMSRALQESMDEGKSKSNMGAVRWMAPESVRKGTYSQYSDVWSFACTVWEVFNRGRMPYGRGRNLDIVREVLSGQRTLEWPDDLDPELHALFTVCLDVDHPKVRPTFARIRDTLDKHLDQEDA